MAALSFLINHYTKLDTQVYKNKDDYICKVPLNIWFNHMAEWNLFDVVNIVILKFHAVLKFPADDL